MPRTRPVLAGNAHRSRAERPHARSFAMPVDLRHTPPPNADLSACGRGIPPPTFDAANLRCRQHFDAARHRTPCSGPKPAFRRRSPTTRHRRECTRVPSTFQPRRFASALSEVLSSGNLPNPAASGPAKAAPGRTRSRENSKRWRRTVATADQFRRSIRSKEQDPPIRLKECLAPPPRRESRCESQCENHCVRARLRRLPARVVPKHAGNRSSNHVGSIAGAGCTERRKASIRSR